jgi:hypothetical protein
VSVEPSAVTPSPIRSAPVARNEAQPSVLPATTVQSPRPSREASSVLTGASGVPGSRTSGNSSRRTASPSIQPGQLRDRQLKSAGLG